MAQDGSLVRAIAPSQRVRVATDSDLRVGKDLLNSRLSLNQEDLARFKAVAGPTGPNRALRAPEPGPACGVENP